MELQLVRHATLRLTYLDCKILVDPYFEAKHSRAPLVDHSRNPMTDLPMPIDTILEDIDLVIISHLHFDHFDETARNHLPKAIKIICQPGDEGKIREYGFTDVTPLVDSLTWEGIKISRTIGQHGTGDWLARMGSVMGFVLQAPSEIVFYWAGDTIYIEAIEETIQRYQPQVVVTHSSGSQFEDHAPIVMDATQTIRVCELIPSGKVIATHMDTIDHGSVSRDALRTAADEAHIALTRLLIPADGDVLSLNL